MNRYHELTVWEQLDIAEMERFIVGAAWGTREERLEYALRICEELCAHFLAANHSQEGEAQAERDSWEHSEEPDGDSANNVLLPLEDSFPIEQGEPLSYREALRDAGRI